MKLISKLVLTGVFVACTSCTTVKEPSDSDPVNIQFSIIEPSETKVIARGFNPDPPATWLGTHREGNTCPAGQFVKTSDLPFPDLTSGSGPKGHVSDNSGQVSVIVSANSPSGIESISVSLLTTANGSNNGAVTETGPNTTSQLAASSSNKATWHIISSKTPFANRKKTKLLTFSYIPGIAKKGIDGAFIAAYARGFAGPPNNRKSVSAFQYVVRQADCIPCTPANGCIMP